VPDSGQDFMYAVGIVVNLLTDDPPEYYDIALRDFGLMLGALTLGRLAWAVPRRQPGGAVPQLRSRHAGRAPPRAAQAARRR